MSSKKGKRGFVRAAGYLTKGTVGDESIKAICVVQTTIKELKMHYQK